MIAASGVDTAKFINYLRTQMQVQTPFHLSSWASLSITDLIDSSYNTNVYTYTQYDDTYDTHEFELFKSGFAESFGIEPNMLATNSYDLVYLLEEAITENDSEEIEEIKEYIVNKGSFVGMNGNYFINTYGDCEKSVYKLLIKEGEFVLMTN